jgi:hypothetical protein
MVSKKCLEAVNSLRTDTDYATADIDLEKALIDFTDDEVRHVLNTYIPVDRCEFLQCCKRYKNNDKEITAHLYGFSSMASEIEELTRLQRIISAGNK